MRVFAENSLFDPDKSLRFIGIIITGMKLAPCARGPMGCDVAEFIYLLFTRMLGNRLAIQVSVVMFLLLRVTSVCHC